MNYVKQRKLKYYGSIFLVSFVLILTVVAFISLYQTSIDQRNQVLAKQKEVEYKALETQYLFKKQVQEWKNILLRGYKPGEYDKYHQAFIDSFEATQIAADELRSLINQDSDAILLVTSFLEAHRSALFEYQGALEILRTTNFDANLADNSVRGIDRQPDQMLRDIASIIADGLNLQQQAIQSEYAQYIAILGVGFFALQLLYCFVLIRLTGKLLNITITDKITRQGNRQLFIQSIKDNLNNNRCASFCLLDLDEFKLINETCGNKGGNEYLFAIGNVIGDIVRKQDVVTRISGDEFGLVLQGDDTAQHLKSLQEISLAISKYVFEWQQINISLTCSISMFYMSNQDSETNVESALNCLYVTLQHSKDKGRDAITVYRDDDENINFRKKQMQTVTMISDALAQNRVLLYHQKVNALSSGSRTYSEVLIRIKDTQDNIISPGLFLQAAERFRLITRVDRYVLKNTLEYLRQADDQSHCVSINLSGQTLSDPTFIEYAKTVFEQIPIELRRLGFEITETDIIKNFDEAIKTIGFLKSNGCRISLDDFGTGMSSYGYITELQLDTIKVDGTFIKNIHKNANNQSIVKSIVSLANDLDLHTVAEFVETHEEYETIIGLKMDYIQGYFLHKPELLYNPK